MIISSNKKSRHLLYPFNEYVSNGVYYHSKQNRNYITMYELGNHNNKHTISYARYLMSVKLGRILCKVTETIDHIDNDPTHDILSNLQILTHADNLKKFFSLGKTKKHYYNVTCPMCGKVFEVPEWKVKHKNTNIMNCSRSCLGKYSTDIVNGRITKEKAIELNTRVLIEKPIEQQVFSHEIEPFEKYSHEIKPIKPKRYCKICDNELNSDQIHCCSEKCYNQYKASKSKKPSKEELLSHLETKSFVSVGKLYGVSDNAVRKWCKSYEIDYKSFSHSRFR